MDKICLWADLGSYLPTYDIIYTEWCFFTF